MLQALKPEEIAELLRRALRDKRGFGDQVVHIGDDLLEAIANFANGDARTALSTLEMVVLNGEVGSDGSTTVTAETVEQCTSKKSLLYDKKGEEHYNLISALHKSMRNSDPDAAVYWLARMLEAGEDPLYVARRVIRFASEDIGLADPRALDQAIAVYQDANRPGVEQLLRQGRVDYIYPADYSEGAGLELTVKEIIRRMAVNHRLSEEKHAQLRAVQGT